MINNNNLYEIGRVKKVHSVHGEINIELINDTIDISDDIQFIFLEIDGGLVPFSVISYDLRIRSIIFDLQEIQSKEKAQSYVDSLVFIDKEDIIAGDISEPDPMLQYTGFILCDTKRGVLGRIENLIEYPDNPVFEIIIDDIQVLIPAKKDIIQSVDYEKNTLLMNIPEGLIDLYLEP